MRNFLVRTVSVVVFLGLLAPLVAQGQVQQRPQQQQQTPQAIQLTSEQIEAAAEAYVAIQELRQKYREKHGSLSDADSSKVAEIQAEFRRETQQAMEEAGVSQQNFGMIMKMAQSNANIQEKFVSAIEEAGGEPPQMPDPNQQQRRQQQQQRPAPDVDVNDEQLAEVAEAFVAVQDIRQRYQEKHGSVEDSEKMQQLQQQFQAETQKALQEADVSQELFGKVLQAARSDAELRQRLFSAVEEAGGEVPTQQQPGQQPNPNQ